MWLKWEGCGERKSLWIEGETVLGARLCEALRMSLDTILRKHLKIWSKGSDIIGFMSLILLEALWGLGCRRARVKVGRPSRRYWNCLMGNDDSWGWNGELNIFTQSVLEIDFARPSAISLILVLWLWQEIRSHLPLWTSGKEMATCPQMTFHLVP